MKEKSEGIPINERKQGSGSLKTILEQEVMKVQGGDLIVVGIDKDGKSHLVSCLASDWCKAFVYVFGTW